MSDINICSHFSQQLERNKQNDKIFIRYVFDKLFAARPRQRLTLIQESKSSSLPTSKEKEKKRKEKKSMTVIGTKQIKKTAKKNNKNK